MYVTLFIRAGRQTADRTHLCNYARDKETPAWMRLEVLLLSSSPPPSEFGVCACVTEMQGLKITLFHGSNICSCALMLAPLIFCSPLHPSVIQSSLLASTSVSQECDFSRCLGLDACRGTRLPFIPTFGSLPVCSFTAASASSLTPHHYLHTRTNSSSCRCAVRRKTKRAER